MRVKGVGAQMGVGMRVVKSDCVSARASDRVCLDRGIGGRGGVRDISWVAKRGCVVVCV